jgi:Queuosine biosynthesis protein QueC
MKGRLGKATCTAYGRVASFGVQSVRIGIGGRGWLATKGTVGPRPPSDGAADLLDIAVAVYRSERQLPRRGPTNPNVKYKLTMPVRHPDLWSGRSVELLQDVLGFLGKTEWEVKFTKRPSGAEGFQWATGAERKVSRVALLSGGLDSASGVGAGMVDASNTQLCSYYTRQGSLQRVLAADFGFPPPTQWWQRSVAGSGRSFYYRSFLFLSIAAATANSWGAREIVQFENGVLASAIPPVPSLAMTRHAHPKLHRLFSELLGRVLKGNWRVVNPLWQMTKRQAVQAMVRQIGAERASKVTSATQSCWNLSAPHAFGVRSVGQFIKHANEQCGVCVPCIVRRTAMPDEHFAFDLRHALIRKHRTLSAHFLEYLELLSSVRAAATASELRIILPGEALDLMDGAYTDLKSLERLLRAFAAEFFQSFQL